MFSVRIGSNTYANINAVTFCRHFHKENQQENLEKPCKFQHQKKPHTKSLKVAIAAWLCACCIRPINRKEKLEIRPRPPNWNHAAPSIHKMKLLTKNKNDQRILSLCDKLILLRNESRGFRISQLEWKKKGIGFLNWGLSTFHLGAAVEGMFIFNGKSATLCRSLRAFIAVQRLLPLICLYVSVRIVLECTPVWHCVWSSAHSCVLKAWALSNGQVRGRDENQEVDYNDVDGCYSARWILLLGIILHQKML